jgi:hypothetical protein
MPRGNGGVIGPANIPTTASAKGVWSLVEQMIAKSQGIWPPSVLPDPYFDYTTLLLPGNGTNGAQNNTFLDSSTNNFTITRNGNTTQGTFSPFSQTGWGNYFGAASTKIATTSMTQLGSDFTLELWVYPQSFADYNTIFDNRTSDGDASGFALGLTSAAKVYLYSNSSFLLTTTGTISANTWTHIALVRSGSGSGNVKIYINGVADATTATYTTSFTRTAPSIGDDWNTRSSLQYYGYLSNLRATTGALYTSNFTPSTIPLTTSVSTGTVVLLTCQSNRFRDASASSLTITTSGSPSVQAFSPFNPSASWSAATYGGSGYFDGNSDYLKAPANSAFAFGTGDMTFEAWAYYAGTQGTFSYVTDLRVSGSESTSRFYVYLSGTTLYLGFGSTDDINVATGISKDQWLHIAVVRSGSGSNNVAVFVNGTRTHQRTDTSNFSTNAIPTIGARYGNTDFITGYIGSYRIVKGTAVYDPSQSTITVPTAPLTAITNTSLLLNYTNAGIYDATSKNDLETVGNAQISTAISAKWGSGSMAFDGTGDYLLPPSSPLLVLGSADFTIEWWFYANAISGYMAQMSTGTDVYSPIFGISDGVWKIYISSNGSSWDISNGNTWGSFTTGTWDHWAVTRSGSTFRAFKNGVQNSTWTSSSSIYQATNQIALGRGQNNPSLNGYMQDVRITRGYARYTSNFTAPTAAFPTL